MTKDIPENIKLWVRALRSGKYLQTQGTLKRELDDGKVGYCCLGVYVEAVEGKRVKTETKNSGKEGADKWYFLCEGKIPSFIRDNGTCMNDKGESFNEIADMIEAHYKEDTSDATRIW